ncbi:transglutaminase-like cysteine peptidase [Erythrobacter alti]|uniref:transglutaminase-like cysteine peptidase n=1 Tax=Erythrobacter alti TaxID=1896145 RepID=UPI0030F3A968
MTGNWNTSARRKRTFAKMLLGACASACLLPATAQAIAIPTTAQSANASPFTCSGQIIAPAAAAAASADDGVTTKSEAILGGQPSALDLIRQQQSGLTNSPAPALAASAAPQATLPHGTLPAPGACFVSASLSIDLPSIPALAVSNADDTFLGSGRVGIRRTPFNDDWQRVSATRLSANRASNLLGTGGDMSVETLSLVNRWTNRRITHVDDIAQYGARDYWATAEETLTSRTGDCEDFAILKYQMLAALGFNRGDMYLTLARDLVRNADHAVLIVQVDGRYYMLDNATDVLLPAHVSHGYRATMSFNTESAWLHGFANQVTPPAQTRQIAYRSVSALSSARVTGLSR